MDIERMREFIVFARHLNVTKASQELLMTQSNLSKHIRQIEHELGFALTFRQGASTSLTREGERFLNLCNSIIDTYETTVAECRTSQVVRRTEIVLQEPSYSDYTGLEYYRLIEDMQKLAPEAQMRFFRPYRRNLIDELAEGKIDIYIVYQTPHKIANAAPSAQADGSMVELATDCLSVWCEATSDLAQLESVSLEDLASVRIFSPNDTYSPITNLVRNYAQENGIHLRFQVVDSDRSAMYLAMRRKGCVFVLPSSTKGDIRIQARNDMVFKPIEHGELAFKSYAMLRRGLLDAFPEFEALTRGRIAM